MGRRRGRRGGGGGGAEGDGATVERASALGAQRDAAAAALPPLTDEEGRRAHARRPPAARAAGAPDSATSDPFVRLRVGAEVRKSRVVKETLSPTWDERFEFASSFGAVADDVLADRRLHGLSFNDTLGEASVGLAAVRLGGGEDGGAGRQEGHRRVTIAVEWVAAAASSCAAGGVARRTPTRCAPPSRASSSEMLAPPLRIVNGTLKQGEYAGLDVVVVPASVTRIGEMALFGCSDLESVVLGEGVSSIGIGAFEGCTSLTSLVLPSNLKSIGDSAFAGCSALSRVWGRGCEDLPWAELGSIGANAFRGTAITDVAVPSGVTRLPRGVFADCSALDRVVLPEGLVEIGAGCFENCAALRTISVPPAATIRRGAFSKCSAEGGGGADGAVRGLALVSANCKTLRRA